MEEVCHLEQQSNSNANQGKYRRRNEGKMVMKCGMLYVGIGECYNKVFLGQVRFLVQSLVSLIPFCEGYSNTFFQPLLMSATLYFKRRYFSCSSYMYSRQKITFMQFTVIMQIVLNLCASFVFIFYSNKIDDIRNMISCRNKSVSCIKFKYYSFLSSNTHVLNKYTNRK